MSKELIKIDAPELVGIEESKANQIKATFEPMAEMLTQFEGRYNTLISESQNGITQNVTEDAKRLRLDIAKVRIDTEKIRKEQKEEYLRAGKAIDGVSNILKWAVTEKENKLKEIENYFEIQEKKRIEKLQNDRAELLSEYVEDAHDRDLAKFEDDEFEALLSMKKKEKEDRIAAEKKAEEERLAKEKAEAEERERIRKENEKLKKEAEERERQAKIEAEKREKEERERKAKEELERKAREEKERKEREEYESKLRAEREERERVEREEREKREKVEAELRAKKEAEQKAKEEEEARIQAELSKGDKDKLIDLKSDLEGLKSSYSFKSKKNIEMFNLVCEKIDEAIEMI